MEAEDAGTHAAEFVVRLAEGKKAPPIYIIPEGLVRYTVPSVIHPKKIGQAKTLKIKFRVGRPVDSGIIIISAGGHPIFESKKPRRFLPCIMEQINLAVKQLEGITEPIQVSIKEV